MNTRTHLAVKAVLAAIASLLLNGCTDGRDAAREAGPGAETGAPEERLDEHLAVGTVNSVDTEANTINISHEPVASIDWPAMRMNFQLSDAALAEGLTPGQRVEFGFVIEASGASTVTAIQPLADTD
jgi:membrane fusion protein, copper/silver efflux system